MAPLLCQIVAAARAPSRTGLVVGLALAFLLAASPALSAPTGNRVTADFNNDGFADLAVGIPGQDVITTATIPDAGGVSVIYGTSTGLNASNRQFLTQESATEVSEDFDTFGNALAAGDFNGDGFADLAVGIQSEDLLVPDGAGGTVTIFDAGAVALFHGSASGLVGAGFLHEDSANVAGQAEDGDQFGETLAAADMGKSSEADLAVGRPREDIAVNGLDQADAGAVTLLYGSPAGLSGTGSQQWHQQRSGVTDASESDDRLSLALIAADFGKSGRADLAIGVPFEQSIGGIADAGAVHVLYGSSTGINASGSQFWHQNSTNVNDTLEAFDFFGWALAAANLGRSSRSELIIGVPGEGLSPTLFSVGAVAVLYGTSSGLAAAGDQLWHQNSTGIEDAAEAGDQFGLAVEAGNFGGSAQADLAVGVPSESVGTSVGAGAVNVIYGTSTGLSSAGDQFWHQSSTGIKDSAQADDQFGSSLAAWNFGKSSQLDLAIGVPLEDIDNACGSTSTAANAGSVNVLYGGSTGLSSTGDQALQQDDVALCSEADELFAEALITAPKAPPP